MKSSRVETPHRETDGRTDWTPAIGLGVSRFPQRAAEAGSESATEQQGTRLCSCFHLTLPTSPHQLTSQYTRCLSSMTADSGARAPV